MKTAHFIHTASDGVQVYVRNWLPEGEPKALMLIAHGMAEHGARYERLAEKLTPWPWPRAADAWRDRLDRCSHRRRGIGLVLRGRRHFARGRIDALGTGDELARPAVDL